MVTFSQTSLLLCPEVLGLLHRSTWIHRDGTLVCLSSFAEVRAADGIGRNSRLVHSGRILLDFANRMFEPRDRTSSRVSIYTLLRIPDWPRCLGPLMTFGLLLRNALSKVLRLISPLYAHLRISFRLGPTFLDSKQKVASAFCALKGLAQLVQCPETSIEISRDLEFFVFTA
jgi:hypothetical protein